MAARVLDDPDAQLARAAAQLLGDDQALARIDSRAGRLALSGQGEGALSPVNERDDVEA